MCSSEFVALILRRPNRLERYLAEKRNQALPPFFIMFLPRDQAKSFVETQIRETTYREDALPQKEPGHFLDLAVIGRHTDDQVNRFLQVYCNNLQNV